MKDKEEARQRTQLLKQMREEHEEAVKRTQETRKEQQRIRKAIREALGSEAKTVPAIAEAAGLPAQEVLWHVMAMKKYGLINEMVMDGQYYTYQLAKEHGE